MFDVHGVNEARFIAMQKQVKISILDLAAVHCYAQAHTIVTCMTGD